MRLADLPPPYNDATFAENLRRIVKAPPLGPVVNITPSMTYNELQRIFNDGNRVVAGPGTYWIEGHTIAAPISLEGAGSTTIFKVPPGSTSIPFLIQDLVTEIPFVRFSNFKIDGNLSGQLDAGLIQCNNAWGWFEDLWITGGGTPNAAPPAGVGGIVVSAGSVGSPASMIVMRNCLGEHCTKAAFNITTDAYNCLIDGIVSRRNTGNGESPGIQLNGGINGRVINSAAYENEGNGIVIGQPLNGHNSKFGLLAFNSTYHNGQGTAAGHGIAILNSFATKFGHLKVLNNASWENGVHFNADGINVANYNDVLIQGNTCWGNPLSGINANTSRNIDILDNDCTHNDTASMGAAGILFYGLTRFRIQRNDCIDDEASPTQTNGIVSYTGTASTDGIITDNRVSPNVTGGLVLTVEPTSTVVQPSSLMSADQGDANVTATLGGPSIYRFASALTVNRIMSPPTTAYNGMLVSVVRTGLGGGTLAVFGAKTIPAATAARVDMAYDSAWRLVGYDLL